MYLWVIIEIDYHLQAGAELCQCLYGDSKVSWNSKDLKIRKAPQNSETTWDFHGDLEFPHGMRNPREHGTSSTTLEFPGKCLNPTREAVPSLRHQDHHGSGPRDVSGDAGPEDALLSSVDHT